MDTELGFLGLGAMGEPMVRNLLRAGYPVLAYDPAPERLAATVEAGAEAAGSAAKIAGRAPVVLASLPSSEAFVRLAEEALLPNARAGQVVIELGTTTPPEIRRLARLFGERGAALVEAPVSGGPGGAERRELLMFVGGEAEAVERVRPVLQALTDPARITLCGGSGCGQAVKGVNQLMMGLGAAAYLEAMAFGVRAGVEPEVIRAAVGQKDFPGRWRRDFDGVAGQMTGGKGEEVGVKFRELPYFLREAAESGFELPLTRALHAFCDAGERVVIDDNRPAPSFWRQLMQAGRGAVEETGGDEANSRPGEEKS